MRYILITFLLFGCERLKYLEGDILEDVVKDLLICPIHHRLERVEFDHAYPPKSRSK